MPELPEVETIRRDLEKRIINKKIGSVLILLPRIIDRRLKDFLPGKKIGNIERAGKLLIFRFSGSRKIILLHLKMTGQLIYQAGKRIIAGGHSDNGVIGDLPGRHTRALINFEDGSRLFFNDMRTFGYIKLAEERDLDSIKAKLGPDSLNDKLTVKDYAGIIKRRRTSIKALLLNQEFISGLGNIYVDEILFLAKVRPGRQADSLNNDEIKRIMENIKPVLKRSIKYRGTTFNNYLDSRGEKGGFISKLNVFGRQGSNCRQCSAIIKKIKVAGRGTHFCPQCQQ